tara:strand:+ start:371 stop:580 length:210 start_codon:yes stop_codon:yes gene_type:complete
MKKDSNWLKNRNATKNPKYFNATFYRDKEGNIMVVGNETTVLNRKTDKWERVSTRAFANLLNKQGVAAL